MTHLLLVTAFVFIMALLQGYSSDKIAAYNLRNAGNLTQKKDNAVFMTAAMVVMMFLAAFRSVNVGNDTDEYIRIFNEIISNPDYIDTTRFEKGYLYLNKFVALFTTNPQGILIVTSIIYYTVFIWFFKRHSRNYAFTLIMFYMLMFSATLTMIRQQLAIAFVFIAVDRIVNKHSIRAVIWIFIAFLFHTSAILLLILPILPYIKFNKIFTFIVILICLICTFTDGLYKLCLLVAPGYAHYFSSQYAESGWLAITYQLMSNFVYFVLVKCLVNKKDQAVLFNNKKLLPENEKNLVFWIAFLAFSGFILGYKINLVDRIMLYFTVYFVLFVPNALEKAESKYRVALMFTIACVLTAYMLVVFKYRPDWNRIYPYTFFWQI